MKWQVAAAALFAAFAAAGLAWAVEGNPVTGVVMLVGNPVQGVGVSVESSPGGIIVSQTQTDASGHPIANVTNAEGTWRWQPSAAGNYVISFSGPTVVAACTRAIANQGPTPCERKGRGICIGRAGGAYFPTDAGEGPGVVATVSSAQRQMAAAWLNCDGIVSRAGRASLAPITIETRQVGQPIVIGVGYVAAPAASTTR